MPLLVNLTALDKRLSRTWGTQSVLVTVCMGHASGHCTDLLDTEAVAKHPGRVRFEAANEAHFDIFGLGRARKRVEGGFHHVPDGEWRALEGDRTVFQAGDIENVVDETQ